jgi:hypothetical protein
VARAVATAVAALVGEAVLATVAAAVGEAALVTAAVGEPVVVVVATGDAVTVPVPSGDAAAVGDVVASGVPVVPGVAVCAEAYDMPSTRMPRNTAASDAGMTQRRYFCKWFMFNSPY